MGTKSLSLKHQQSIFGLDIGQTSLKVMQLRQAGSKKPKVVGYGVSQPYPAALIKDGIITDVKELATSLKQLLEKDLIGSITTSQVACTIPTAHTFSHPMKLPKMAKDHLEEAIELEVEQYIPLPPDQLYIDYEITNQDSQNMELLVVAAPRKIVDSYMSFLSAVGLRPVALEPSMNATIRLQKLLSPSSDQPIILVDFGAMAIDIGLFDKTMFANSTLMGGSENITQLISKKLGVSDAKAYEIKNKEGITYSDELRDVVPIIKPVLDELVREIRRIVRYYSERTGNARQVSGIVMAGGGSTLKGLDKYLSEDLKIPTSMLDPWSKLDFGKLTPLEAAVKPLYLTAAGAALLGPAEIYND